VESSVLEQADAGAIAVCFGAGAAGADGENKCVAQTFDHPRAIDKCTDVEFAFATCDACVFTFEDRCGA
jgi:hypothetical protein